MAPSLLGLPLLALEGASIVTGTSIITTATTISATMAATIAGVATVGLLTVSGALYLALWTRSG